MKKRLLCMLLLLLMVVQYLPVTAHAAYSGACGENLTWELTDDKTLIISGTGPMKNYDYYSMPWYTQRMNIKAVVIKDGVTTIGSSAFSYCRNLTSVEMGNSVTTIGNDAFYRCSGLPSVEIDNSVTTIGDDAFYDCVSLTSVTMGNSVTTIGENTFYNCASLTDVCFQGDAPTTVGEDVFDKEKVTLYCTANASGWTDSDAYDAKACTWNGYKLEVMEPEISGTITHAARSLSLDGAIIINQYLYIEGFDDVNVEENGGVLFFKEAVSEAEATVENASAIDQQGLTYDAEKDRYGQVSHGIAAKEYGDTIYIRGYVKDNNGNYHYGDLMEYGVRAYCEGRLEKSSDQKLKNICISLLHYGAAAQTYLNYHTENLANAAIAAQYPNFAWNAALLDEVATVNSSISSSSNVAVTNKSLSLEGTILINFYAKVYNVEAEQVEVLLWRGVDGKLTVRNATETIAAEYDAEKDRYGVQSMGIFAKNYGETVFACAKVTDTDGIVHYSEIVGYSPEAYAASRLEKSSDVQLKELVKCMTIYGEQARVYFQ